MKEKLNRKGSCSPKVGGRVGYYNTELKDWLMFIASTENIADAAELLIWLKGGKG
jgi:hypothetical protein